MAFGIVINKGDILHNNSFVMLSVIMLNVVMLNVVMLNVVMLNVVMLSVVGPIRCLTTETRTAV
jgi:hypothetical protein